MLGVIRAWFNEHYSLNYGVVTAGPLVVDSIRVTGATRQGRTDRHADSPAHFHLAGAHWRQRPTRHLLQPDRCRSGKLDNGVEIKAGSAGYIVGVLCKHASGGTYDWVQQQSPGDAALADPPDGCSRSSRRGRISAVSRRRRNGGVSRLVGFWTVIGTRR